MPTCVTARRCPARVSFVDCAAGRLLETTRRCAECAETCSGAAGRACCRGGGRLMQAMAVTTIVATQRTVLHMTNVRIR